MNLTDRISKNFTYAEVIGSDKAREFDIDNNLPSIYYMNVINVAVHILEPIRAHFEIPFSPNSWYRCFKLNKLVSGSNASDHMIGAAVDIKIPDVSLLTLAKWIRDNLEFDQLILEPTWVHVSYKNNNNRLQVLRNENGKYLSGLINEL